jgi:CspA family cold shock protein
MMHGKVKFFDQVKGFGFVSPEDGSEDVFVHVNAVRRAGLLGLFGGQKVEFDVVFGPRDKMEADNLKLV